MPAASLALTTEGTQWVVCLWLLASKATMPDKLADNTTPRGDIFQTEMQLLQTAVTEGLKPPAKTLKDKNKKV